MQQIGFKKFPRRVLIGVGIAAIIIFSIMVFSPHKASTHQLAKLPHNEPITTGQGAPIFILTWQDVEIQQFGNAPIVYAASQPVILKAPWSMVWACNPAADVNIAIEIDASDAFYQHTLVETCSQSGGHEVITTSGSFTFAVRAFGVWSLAVYEGSSGGIAATIPPIPTPTPVPTATPTASLTYQIEQTGNYNSKSFSPSASWYMWGACNAPGGWIGDDPVQVQVIDESTGQSIGTYTFKFCNGNFNAHEWSQIYPSGTYHLIIQTTASYHIGIYEYAY